MWEMNTETLAKELKLYAMNVKGERPDWSLKQCVNHVVNFHQSRIDGVLQQEARDHVQGRIPAESFIDLVKSYSSEHGMKVAEATRQAANDRPDLYLQFDRQVKNRGRVSLSELSGRVDARVKQYMKAKGVTDYKVALKKVLADSQA